MDSLERAVNLYCEGKSLHDVAIECEIPYTTLRRKLKKLGLVRRYTRRETDDLVGEKFGELKVVGKFVESQGRVLWICECVCGNEQKVRTSRLLNGKVESCGACVMKGDKNHRWKGHEGLSGTRWKFIKGRTKRASRTLDFSISIEYAWELYQNQKGRCALSGLDISFPKTVSDYGDASLDRIDSAKGYIEGNVQWVHKDLNKMKFDLPEDRFIELCILVSKNKGG